jgi:hypothetical protein
MQNEMTAEPGNRDAEHDGEDVFVHDQTPFAVSTSDRFQSMCAASRAAGGAACPSGETGKIVAIFLF